MIKKTQTNRLNHWVDNIQPFTVIQTQTKSRPTHLLVLPVDQRHLELELGGIDAEHPRAVLPVQAVHAVTLDPRDVDRQVQGADDTVVTVRGAFVSNKDPRDPILTFYITL